MTRTCMGMCPPPPSLPPSLSLSLSRSRSLSLSLSLSPALRPSCAYIHTVFGSRIQNTGRTLFLPQAPRSYPIPMAHRVTPGHPEVTPGTKSYWHTSTTPPLVWQTKYVKCVRAIANHIINTISFGDKTMLKVGNRH